MSRSTCASCGQHLEFSEEMSGRQVACPNCGAKTRLDNPAFPEIRIPKQKDPEVREAGSSPVAAFASLLQENIGKVIVGKREEIVWLLTAFLAEGHVLLEDVPGVAKTMLARALAKSVGCSFKRLQCTPDLLPNDITGSSIFNPKTTAFEFRPGPLFAQIVLADEINRATPRTQSALLEAMAEGKITADGVNYDLAPPFFLIATQNPIDHEGTFPLPEAQLDRFFFKLIVGYPTGEELTEVLTRTTEGARPELARVLTKEQVIELQKLARQVPVASHVKDYAVRLVLASHPKTETAAPIANQYLRFGSSPRGGQTLLLAAKVRALTRGRFNVSFEDIQTVALAALRHRLILNFEAEAEGITTDHVIAQILKDVPRDVAAIEA